MTHVFKCAWLDRLAESYTSTCSMAGTVLKYVLPRINTNILVRNPPAPAGELRQQAAPTLPRLACVESTDTGVLEYWSMQVRQ